MIKPIYQTIQLLRFPFSLFLLPVSLFSCWINASTFDSKMWLILAIWHILVYPSSNGYNSYNDRDEGPIGGLEKPPQPTEYLRITANSMDFAAIMLALFMDVFFAGFVLMYIIASRLYSYREVRLKKYPILGYLVVVFFQGFWVFMANTFAITHSFQFTQNQILAAITSSFFIGTIYPLTQIFQHEADAKDGVKTLSIMLGIKGTFIYAAILFLAVNIAMYFILTVRDFSLFSIIMLPSMLYFLYWGFISFKNEAHVTFKNTMIMLVSAAISLNLFFIVLINLT